METSASKTRITITAKPDVVAVHFDVDRKIDRRASDGAAFAGKGFTRLTFGCPRETLRIALERIDEAVKAIDKPTRF